MRKKAKRDLISDLFPVLAYSPKEQFFHLEKSALGFGFMCTPLTGGDDRMVDRFNNLMNLAWPLETILQFCLWTSPDLVPERVLLSGVDGNSEEGISQVLQEVRAKRVDYLRQGTVTPIDGSGLLLRDIKLIITARLPLAGGVPKDKETASARELQDAAMETLKSCNFRPQAMTAEDYIRFMETILNWSPEAGWRHETAAQYDRGRLIQDQLADHNTDLQLFRDHIRLGGKVVKLLSPKRLPETGYFGLANRFLLDPLTGSRGIRENLLITAAIYFPDTERARGKLEKEHQWVINQTYGPLLKFAPRLGKKKTSYDDLFEGLNMGDRLVKMFLGAALFCDPENVSSAVANLQAFWRESSIQMLEDRFVCLPMFLHCLPFGAEPEVVKDMNRYRTLVSRQALVFLPIFGSWKGTETPAMQFIGRDGQLMFFDLFDSPTNYNAVIAAQSGSGKSFLTNEIIMQYLSIGWPGLGHRHWPVLREAGQGLGRDLHGLWVRLRCLPKPIFYCPGLQRGCGHAGRPGNRDGGSDGAAGRFPVGGVAAGAQQGLATGRPGDEH